MRNPSQFVKIPPNAGKTLHFLNYSTANAEKQHLISSRRGGKAGIFSGGGMNLYPAE